MSAARGRNANGEGTVYQRSDGRWAGQCYLTETDGRRMRRTLYGSSRREVERKVEDLLEREAAGRRVAPVVLTLGEYLEEWLSQIVVHRVRANTLSAYRFEAERYLLPDLGRKKLASLSPRDLRLYFESLRQRGVGARTVVYVHATLRAALEDAVREEIVDRNVAKLVSVPRPPRVERTPLSVEEVRVLLEAHREERVFALLVVFALLGLRRSEALGLGWEDVDLEGGSIQIKRGLQRTSAGLVTLPTKTARSRRTIPLPKMVVEALLATGSGRSGSVSSWRSGGRSRGSCSRTRSVGRWSLGRAPGWSRTRVVTPGCGWCGCTTSGTAVSRCCWGWGCLLARRWRSPGTRHWR